MAWTYGKVLTVEQLIDYITANDKSNHPQIHIHHTYIPDHNDFDGSNYLKLQNAMRNAHLKRGFVTIAQQVSLFPNGKFVLGRDINLPPASATNYNDSDTDGIHPFMVETVGNFDTGHDLFKHPQSTALFKLVAYFMKYEGATIKFHNEMSSKTCPGSGINKKWFVAEAQKEVSGCNCSNPRLTTPQPVYVPYPGHLIKRGSRGPVVGKIQRKLGGLVIDGIYGQKTMNAVTKFQKSHGLVTDGIVGPRTWRDLFS
jgi:hypothetical protein